MRSSRRQVVLAFLVTAVSLFGVGARAGAQGDPAQELAERYAPVMMLKAQEAVCDTDGEPYAPMSVDALLDNPQVFLRQVGSQNPVLMNGAGASDVFGLSEGWFLDFPGDALNPGCVFERDFRAFTEGQPSVVYAHIATQDDEPDKLALQYWFFWYYNDWNNKHEGDWEGIQLLFDVGTVEEALATDPVSVGYAQHEGGELAAWGDDKLERRGTRPLVYSSAGSHASYFGPAVYLGRSGSEGFGCDNTDGPSVAVEPEVVVLPDSVDDPDDPLAWLAFEGRWGERQSGPFNGPTGPALKERWTHPVEWHDNLRSGSVIVPAGDEAATGLINAFCDVVELGSAQLVTLQQNPTYLLIGIVIVFALVSFALSRTDWSVVPPLPIVGRRRAGQLIKAASRLLLADPKRFFVAGLVYAPIAIVVGLFVGIVRFVPFVDAALDTEQDIGAVGTVLAVTVGSLGHFAGLTVVTAVVSVLMRDLEDGGDMTAVAALGVVWRRFGDLAAAFGRGFAIVGVLSISVVGIPWGIRQFIRYQFIAQVTMLEDHRRQAALDRSSQLIIGRWLHTAAVIALLNALVAVFSLIVGLLLLVLLSGLPLWLFSVLISLFSVLIIPYTSIAYVLLYGNAKAEEASESAVNPQTLDAARS